MDPALAPHLEPRAANRDAARVLRWAAEAVRERGVFRIALAGGAGLRPLLTAIATESERAQPRFDRWQVFCCEARHVPPHHRDSCYRMAEEALLGRVPVLPEHLYRIRAEYNDPHQAARCYESQLRRVFGMPPGALPCGVWIDA